MSDLRLKKLWQLLAITTSGILVGIGLCYRVPFNMDDNPHFLLPILGSVCIAFFGLWTAAVLVLHLSYRRLRKGKPPQ
jgi:hypothetical protein